MRATLEGGDEAGGVHKVQAWVTRARMEAVGETHWTSADDNDKLSGAVTQVQEGRDSRIMEGSVEIREQLYQEEEVGRGSRRAGVRGCRRGRG